MRRPLSILALVAIFALLGCEDDGTGPNDQNLEVATFEVVVGDRTTLTTTPVQVVARSADGVSIVNFDDIGLEYQFASGAWTPLTLSLQGPSVCWDDDPGGGFVFVCAGEALHTARHTFTSSGTYSFRVSADRFDLTSGVQYSTSMDIDRISRSSGGYDIGFESYPGTIRVGEAIELDFYITGGAGDAVVVCRETGVAPESHDVPDPGDGIYSIQHTFSVAGLARVTLEFTDENGDPAEVTFEVNVLE